jgi:hypothetical protein
MLALAGCGGAERAKTPSTEHEAKTSSPREPAESEGSEGEAALARIPAADRHAYYRIATATGVLSRGASLLAVAHRRRARDTAALLATRPQIAALRPRDPLLGRVRIQLIVAMDQAIRSRRSTRSAIRSAPSSLSAATAIVQGLTGYAKAHPAVAALVPD